MCWRRTHSQKNDVLARGELWNESYPVLEILSVLPVMRDTTSELRRRMQPNYCPPVPYARRILPFINPTPTLGLLQLDRTGFYFGGTERERGGLFRSLHYSLLLKREWSYLLLSVHGTSTIRHGIDEGYTGILIYLAAAIHFRFSPALSDFSFYLSSKW
jgi:hypothetical protein